MIISFSGASHSGKTSFSHAMKDFYGDKVIIFNEIIRKEGGIKNFKFKSIDELRKDPQKYLSIQMQIIPEKIAQEIMVKTEIDEPDKIIIFDRSLIDSFYYCMFYVNKNQNKKVDAALFNFLNMVYEAALEHIRDVYHRIFLFKPIYSNNSVDPFRPKLLDISQTIEYKMIRSLTYGMAYDVGSHFKVVDVNPLMINPEEFYNAYLRT